MSIHDEVMSEINQGLEGRNKGIPMGISTLGNEICNLLPSTYYLLGGESGTGKTALADTIFCVNPIDYLMKNENKTNKRLKIFYNSLEISKKRKMTKWACIKLWKDYGIIIDSKTLLGMRESKISQEIYDKVKETRDYFERVEDYMVFNDQGVHPTKIYYNVKEYCESVGKFIDKVIPHKDGTSHTEKVYIPNNPDEIVLKITDHVGLVRGEKDAYENKQKLDKHSHYSVDARNIYGVSSVEISQFNRDLADYGRQKFKQLAPQDADFKGTGNMYEDCDTCLALFSPRRHGIKNYLNYDITLLKNRVMFSYILKNRDGNDNIAFALNFLGEAGYYRKMPSPTELDTNPMLLEQVIKFIK
jgi:hypothetical protein